MKIQSVSVKPQSISSRYVACGLRLLVPHIPCTTFFMLMKIFYLIVGGVAEAPVHDSDNNVLEKYSRNPRATTPGIKLDFCTATVTSAARSTC
jgi:hypothetical protein